MMWPTSVTLLKFKNFADLAEFADELNALMEQRRRRAQANG